MTDKLNKLCMYMIYEHRYELHVCKIVYLKYNYFRILITFYISTEWTN